MVAAVIGGCLAPYDQTTDQDITAVHKRLIAHFTAVTQPAATQPVDPTFYPSIRADLDSLKVRMGARGDDPSLKPQIALLDEILGQVDDARRLEMSGLHVPAAWQTVCDGLDTNVKGFLTAELQRK